MVKGVNKRVIEVNQTGNKFFEKIVFYITPEYSDASVEDIKRATDGFGFALRESMGAVEVPNLRNRYKAKKRKKIISFAALGCVLAITVYILLRIL